MASTRSFHDYATGGQMLLWAARHWMRAYRSDRPLPTCVWQSFAVADLSVAYRQLTELLSVVVFREFPPEAFAAPSATGVTRDETVFMRMLVAVDAGEPGRAMRLVEDRASPAIARTVLLHATELVTQLRRAGHRIAQRPVAFAGRPTPTGTVPLHTSGWSSPVLN